MEHLAIPIELQEQSPAKIALFDDDKATPLGKDQVFGLHYDVLAALQHGQPYKLLKAFLRASEDHNYIRALPATTLKEVLRNVNPNYFLDSFKAVHQDLGEDSPYINYIHKDFRSLHEVFQEYAGWIGVLVSKWRDHGHKFGLAEYTLLLNIARLIGEGKTAQRVWNAMIADRIDPDTTCYNYFFEARCWSDAYDPWEKYRLRVVPDRLDKRAAEQGRPSYLGCKIGTRGIRRETIENFDFMVKNGVKPDVNTFAMLIQAMGREGDMEGVQSVIKQVWDVDVESVLNEEDTELLFENCLSPNSPTYPNKELLFTIAHIFGSNNQIPAALRVVDIFSRKFDIEIDFETWNQLFKWTSVLSSKRSRSHREKGRDVGKLPLASVGNLWNTMTSEPYNIKPPMPMYNRYMKNMVMRAVLDAGLELMRSGKALHEAQKKVTEDLHARVQDLESTYLQDPTFTEPEAGSVLWELERELETEKLKLYRDYVMICRWVRLVVARRRWISSDNERRLGWERIMIPDLMREYWDYRPANGLSYMTLTCAVEFHPDRPVEMAIESTDGIVPGVMVVQDTEECQVEPLRDTPLLRRFERRIRLDGPKIKGPDGTSTTFQVFQ